MPLEGHWQRTQAPLRSISRRELHALWITAVAIVGAVAVLLSTAGGSSSARSAGCIDATIASTTGGAHVHACGAQARQFCALQHRRDTVEAHAMRADCARARP